MNKARYITGLMFLGLLLGATFAHADSGGAAADTFACVSVTAVDVAGEERDGFCTAPAPGSLGAKLNISQNSGCGKYQCTMLGQCWPTEGVCHGGVCDSHKGCRRK